MIRGVVFDLDGVLADTEPVYQAMRTEYLSRFGVTLTPEQSRAFTGLRFLTGLEMLRAELPETVFRNGSRVSLRPDICREGSTRCAAARTSDGENRSRMSI